MEENLCEITIIHEDVVKKVKKIMPEDDEIYDLAEFFKVFADSTRMKMIYALMENELCVCDLANIVNTTQSAISHQLKILRQSKLVKFRKEGKVVYYSLDDEHISQIVKKGREHIEEL
ncbi:MAG: ArsR/SmtB family transcription factor [Clostridia bacterium]